MTGRFYRRIVTAALICGFTIALPSRASADEVLDWNQVLITAIGEAGLPGPAGFRLMAIVQVAVYDAVNGIDYRYTPMHVTVKGPQHASRRAAAVQAAYTTLVALFPVLPSLEYAADVKRGQAGWRGQEHRAHARPDRSREFLGRHGANLLEPHRGAVVQVRSPGDRRQRAAPRDAERGDGRCRHRVLGGEVLLRVLAADKVNR